MTHQKPDSGRASASSKDGAQRRSISGQLVNLLLGLVMIAPWVLKRVAYAVLIGLAVFCLLEVLFRLYPAGPNQRDDSFAYCSGESTRERFHPDLGWTATPGSDLFMKVFREDGWRRYTHDDAGFRVMDRSGVEEVVVLGDSYTYGINVDNADTYAARLDAWLPETAFRNYAIEGFGTAQALSTYRTFAAGRGHKAIILGYCLHNDLFDNMLDMQEKPKYEIVDGLAELVRRPVQTPMKRLKKLVLSLRAHSKVASNLVIWMRTMRLKRFVESMSTDEAVLERAAELTRALLRTLARDAQADGADMLLLVLPYRHTQDWQEPLDALQRRIIRDVADSEPNVSVLDLGQGAFATAEAQARPLYGLRDIHFSPWGQYVASKAVMGWLQERGIAPRESVPPMFVDSPPVLDLPPCGSTRSVP